MPFDLKMYQDIFQMCMDQDTDFPTQIIAIHNDICIFNQTPEEHDRHLIQLKVTALKKSIIFNNSKCRIWQPEIIFYSAKFTSQGMKLNLTKVQDLSTPDNQMKCQSFLGVINCLQPFIPGLTDKTNFLQEQLSEWDWNTSPDVAFQ